MLLISLPHDGQKLTRNLSSPSSICGIVRMSGKSENLIHLRLFAIRLKVSQQYSVGFGSAFRLSVEVVTGDWFGHVPATWYLRHVSQNSIIMVFHSFHHGCAPTYSRACFNFSIKSSFTISMTPIA